MSSVTMPFWHNGYGIGGTMVIILDFFWFIVYNCVFISSYLMQVVYTFVELLPSSMIQGYHFSGNLEMSGNSAKVGVKAQSQGKVMEFV